MRGERRAATCLEQWGDTMGTLEALRFERKHVGQNPPRRTLKKEAYLKLPFLTAAIDSF